MNDHSLSKEINWYYMLAFILSAFLFGFGARIAQALNMSVIVGNRVATLLSQLAPPLAVWGTSLRYPNVGGANLAVQGRFPLLPCLLVPTLAVGVQHYVLQSQDSLYQPSPFFASAGLSLLTVFTIFLGSFLEEIGWRGYLHGKLRQHMRPVFSALLTAILWGFWYFHKIRQVGIQGYFLFVLSVVPLGVVMAYINEKAGLSILPSTLLLSLLKIAHYAVIAQREGSSSYLISFVVFTLFVVSLYFQDPDFFRAPHNSENIS